VLLKKQEIAAASQVFSNKGATRYQLVKKREKDNGAPLAT
jgi:hypothetical protein